MIILSIYFLILYFFLVFLILLWLRNKKGEAKVKVQSATPFASVLVAARNEEANIVRCLEALSKLNYPKDKIEILIGNDKSEDSTEKLVREFIKDKTQFSIYNIETDLGEARGKANVLAHLARKAKGEYFFITDADIAVPTGWISGLLKYVDENIGIVSGATNIEGESLFAKLQSLEWIYAFGMVKTVSDINIPVSAVGNNMMISREAYESVGGYENIPFSVTEDLQLFNETLKKGWAYRNVIDHEVLANSNPVETLSKLIKQRKRWMTGAVKLPFILVLSLFVQAIFFPMIIAMLFIFPALGLILWITKILLQQVFTALVMRRMKVWPGALKYFIIYEIYTNVFAFFLLIYFALPYKVEWKGRKY